MKRCPECRRDYYDDTLLYCLDDGNALLEGPSSGDDSETRILGAEGADRVRRASLGTPSASTIAIDGASGSTDVQMDEGFWVAVLPFRYRGASTELDALAEGFAEDIVTGLSRFSYLRVIALSSASQYTSDTGDVRAIGRELGARYVMEGSLRQSGTKLRLAVQLVDANTGAHLWAENYERNFDPDRVFELQDELVPQIVATVADVHGVLPRSMRAALPDRAPGDISPYEAFVRSFTYMERITPEALTDAMAELESAVRKAPAYADAWAQIAGLYSQDYGQGFDLYQDALIRGEAAARKAVEAGPSNHLAWFSLAQVLFFQKEIEGFRDAAERAAALNPMDGNSIAFLGEMLIHKCDYDRGLEMTTRAKQLNPHHPGWYWYADFIHAYRHSDYAAALNFVRKVNLPGHWAQQMMMAAVCGQLGDKEGSDKAVRDALKLRPDLASTVRANLDRWWKPEFVGHLIDGLRKAGLDVPRPDNTGSALEDKL